MEPSASHLVVIPSYNTGPRLAGVVAEALRSWRPVLVVVDGSTDGSDRPLRELASGEPGLSVLVLPKNSGKGAAVLAGLAAARDRGFSHALVMDADGQHPAAGIAQFMECSRRHPAAMILGRPVFGPDVPLARLYGRKLSIGAVRLETLGAGIADPLYGFRVYPVQPLLDVLGPRRGGRRYDFDTEAAVRLFWAGVEPINLPSPSITSATTSRSSSCTPAWSLNWPCSGGRRRFATAAAGQRPGTAPRARALRADDPRAPARPCTCGDSGRHGPG
jgi:glycosyltransferase involved in cell wall biosynthesis